MSTPKTILSDDIIYLEADINYSIFHFENGKKWISSFTLKYYQNKVEINHFLRIHRSFLLNPQYITEVSKRGRDAYIKLANGKELKVARRKHKLIAGL